jgi:hypothetical protein
MMKLTTLFATATYLLSFATTNAEEYVYGKDPKKDAEYDISMGMAGIQQAAKDPKLLAQLFQDMQVSACNADASLDCNLQRASRLVVHLEQLLVFQSTCLIPLFQYKRITHHLS